jgi:hypothetical protein
MGWYRLHGRSDHLVRVGNRNTGPLCSIIDGYNASQSLNFSAKLENFVKSSYCLVYQLLAEPNLRLAKASSPVYLRNRCQKGGQQLRLPVRQPLRVAKGGSEQQRTGSFNEKEGVQTRLF